MKRASSLAGRLSELSLRLRSRARVLPDRRRADRRFQVASEVLRLEDRCLLSGVPIPAGQLAGHQVPLSNIFWNGGPSTVSGQNLPSPSASGAMKTITLTNNGPDTVYPFIRGENKGKDPNATTTNQYYDPQDVHGHEFRQYVGYQMSTGEYMLGLPSGASVTIQIPLVLWDGDNLYIATDPNYLTTNNPVYNYDTSASISIAGTTPSGTTPANTTTWVTNSSNYPAGESPIVMFYFSETPKTVLRAAPAQLGEWTFRDPYLKNFINDPLQTFPLINYDVSYVNNLAGPVSMEATKVPITVGDRLSTTTPPTYLGSQDFGWNPTNYDKPSFVNPIQDFVANEGKARLGKYFGGKGWPKYYNPNPGDIVIPSGANIFSDSPLTNARSPYAADNNYYLLTSTNHGAGPIQLASMGAEYSQGDTIHFATNYLPQLQKLKHEIDAKQHLVVVASLKDYPPGTRVTDVNLKELTVTVDHTHSGRTNGGVYDINRPVNDYAVTDITRLWYAWANYYVKHNHFKHETASASYQPTLPNGPTNMITLTSAPRTPLGVGMTVTGPGIRPGTTILSIADPRGNPIGKADAIGERIFLSLVPSDLTPRTQEYTFGRPKEIPYTSQVDPYDLTFGPAQEKKALLFAGSVYATISAEAPVLQPSGLPSPAQRLIAQIIQFYANLPTDTQPGGKNLTGQVRDVVKSVLRGVWNFIAVPNQNDWYPAPWKKTGGKAFNVYNLNPYVYFVHKVENMAGYAFSVDDDVANPAAAGPVLASDSTPGNPVYNHTPNNLQIAFGGIQGFVNQKEWFPTIPWGQINTTATISKVGGTSDYKNDYMVTFAGPLTPSDYLILFNQINNPGDGQIGASITAPGYLAPGTTLIHKGPNGDNLPQIVLSKPPLKVTAPGETIPVTITGNEPA